MKNKLRQPFHDIEETYGIIRGQRYNWYEDDIDLPDEIHSGQCAKRCKSGVNGRVEILKDGFILVRGENWHENRLSVSLDCANKPKSLVQEDL